jgi:exodeoxyribonuclease V beta subunit
MAALLDGLRIADMAAGSDDDIHQIEDEGDKVQILTMHVSKGLEFPVVFIAGGLTVRKDGGIQVYHTADPVHPEYNCRKVIDLTASTGNELAEKEIEEENKRLYYVAFTRSRLKLYIPYYPDERNYSWLGPICRFVSHSIGQVFLHPEDATLPGGGWHDASITAAVTSDPKATRYEAKQEPLSPLTGNLLPDQTDYRHRRIFLESFSSIGRRLVHPRDSIGRPAAFQLVRRGSTGRR